VSWGGSEIQPNPGNSNTDNIRGVRRLFAEFLGGSCVEAQASRQRHAWLSWTFSAAVVGSAAACVGLEEAVTATRADRTAPSRHHPRSLSDAVSWRPAAGKDWLMTDGASNQPTVLSVTVPWQSQEPDGRTDGRTLFIKTELRQHKDDAPAARRNNNYVHNKMLQWVRRWSN